VRQRREGYRGYSIYQPTQRAQIMNSIIYIVGLVVIIAFILGYFGLR
jgi:hypothetical protein